MTAKFGVRDWYIMGEMPHSTEQIFTMTRGDKRGCQGSNSLEHAQPGNKAPRQAVAAMGGKSTPLGGVHLRMPVGKRVEKRQGANTVRVKEHFCGVEQNSHVGARRTEGESEPGLWCVNIIVPAAFGLSCFNAHSFMACVKLKS
ncbi:unnamed protein product [Protopolystoma xenopodis]|uniref:Uncharacterized protein n=1 Tax=Protopolystoma xenopodis TaxID=117903 RepID=A0A3S5CTR3_9PLAT|nr:unnamed protein product [Protopolystoma xenopodis]